MKTELKYMKKPLKPDIKHKVLDEIHKSLDRIEERYKVRIRLNIEEIKPVDKGNKIKRK